jgi:polygalacturonase
MSENSDTGYGLRPQLVNFVECERVLMKDVQPDQLSFLGHPSSASKSITVDGVKVYNEGPNGDGCDPEACSERHHQELCVPHRRRLHRYQEWT